MIKKPTSTTPSAHPLDKAAGWSWRIVAIAAFLALIIFVIIQLKVIIIPFIVALLVTALLFPLVRRLNRAGVKKGLAVAISLLAFGVIVAGLIFVVAKQTSSAYPELRDRFQTSLHDLSAALAAGPLDINPADVTNSINGFITSLQTNSDLLSAGLISSVGSTTGHIFAGIFLAFFAVIFLLLDGKNIWKWFVSLFPRQSQEKLLDAGFSGWNTLISFVKSQIAVAGVDAIGIGLGALILGVPLAIPIAVLVFLGSFIPVVGAVITGSIAVLLALFFNGWIIALIMIGVVLLVQLIEGHVLQPFLVGKAVNVHPLAVVFAVAIGSLLAGIPGALFAVPVVAVANVMITKLLKKS